jgi:hypothetical protein
MDRAQPNLPVGDTKEATVINNVKDVSLKVLKAASKVEEISSIMKLLPLFIIILTIAAIIIMFIVLMIFISNPTTSNISILISQNIYSSVYLFISIINLIVICYIANPILLTNNVVPVTNQIPDVFTNINKIITAATFPVMIVELIFIVLAVMLITMLLVIVSSLVRTYYVIQCPLDKKVQVLWWGKTVDFFMHLSLICSFVIYVVFQISNRVTPSSNRVNESYARKLFIITLVYYIIQLLFSSIEYIISDNIISINKWENVTEVCDGTSTEVCDGTSTNTSMSHTDILYLVLNVILCIVIWIIITIVIGCYVTIGANTISLMELINMISKAFMTLLSGKMTSASIDKFFSEVKKIINEALNTVPENKRPLWIPSYINTLKPRLLSLFPGDKFSVVPVKIVYKA